jgi:hypothetical protein
MKGSADGKRSLPGTREMRLSAADYHVMTDKPRSFNFLDSDRREAMGS